MFDTAQEIVRRTEQALKNDEKTPSLVIVLNEAKKVFSERHDQTALQLVAQMRANLMSTTTHGQYESPIFPSPAGRALFFEAQRKLAEEHGLYINHRSGRLAIGPWAAAVGEVATFRENNWAQHKVIFLDTADRTGTYGCFYQIGASVVNRSYSKSLETPNALLAVTMNELAHSYLTAHGFDANSRSISLAGIDTSKYPSGSPEELFLRRLRDRQSITANELHELYSDCCSTMQEPVFDQTRMLNHLTGHNAFEQAKREMGKSTEYDSYNVTDDQFRSFINDALAERGKPYLLEDLIRKLVSHEKQWLAIDDQLQQHPKNPALLAEQKEVVADYKQIKADGRKEILETLGPEGLELQRRVYAHCGAELLQLVRGLPGWKD